MSLESRKPFMSAVRSRTGAVTGNTNKKSTRFLPRLNPNFSNNSQWAKNNLPILKKNIIREKTPQIVIHLFEKINYNFTEFLIMNTRY